VRPSRAKPKTGWSLRELANLSGVAGRTIRLYLQRGVGLLLVQERGQRQAAETAEGVPDELAP